MNNQKLIAEITLVSVVSDSEVKLRVRTMDGREFRVSLQDDETVCITAQTLTFDQMEDVFDRSRVETDKLLDKLKRIE